jgi:UDP-N-acetylmuramate--alanine ligase
MSVASPRRQPEELIDLSFSRRCHVVGIGGPGMSPLASLLAARGHVVTGSDMRDSEVTEILRSEGIAISIGHDASLVKDADVVTYSTAIPMSNVEIVAAQSSGVALRHRSGLLASLCAVTNCIGVAGTHGKTTTTGLLTHILSVAGKDPSCIVGGQVEGMPVGARHGASEFLVLECDESDGTLDVLPLSHLIVTNVDVDHLDYFGSFEQLQKTFVDAATRTSGFVVVNVDDSSSEPMRYALQGESRLRTFGTANSADVRVLSVVSEPAGILIHLEIDGVAVECRSPLRGDHNAMNIAGAIAMSTALGVDASVACTAVETFRGVQRRFTERGEFNNAILVDDYAHLPAEIEAAIATARTHPRASGKTIAVFQPNRFHRIAAMADSYADCFNNADVVVITDVYASGTAFIEGVTGELVVNAIRASHPNAHVVWAPSRADIVTAVSACIAPGDICISMGCGDIETFPDDLMNARLA